MPELPEVEVVKRSLESKILNLVIKKVKINDVNLRYKVSKSELLKFKGGKIVKILRRSKFLIFKNDKNFYLLAHLGMTGKFFFVNRKNIKFKTSFYYQLDKRKDYKHDRIIFYLQNKQKLIYNDVRKFGFVKVYDFKNYINNIHLKNLGPEPLEKKYNFNYLKKYLIGRKRNIKDILMDQNCIAGLGNIYVNEILFLSRVNPRRSVKKIRDFELKKIVVITKKILKKSIKLGGSSIKDFSSDNGKKGSFQQFFKVYGREGQICSNTDCNTKIIRIVISNRSTFLCNKCQK